MNYGKCHSFLNEHTFMNRSISWIDQMIRYSHCQYNNFCTNYRHLLNIILDISKPDIENIRDTIFFKHEPNSPKTASRPMYTAPVLRRQISPLLLQKQTKNMNRAIYHVNTLSGLFRSQDLKRSAPSAEYFVWIDRMTSPI